MNTSADIPLTVDRDKSGRVVTAAGPGLVDLQVNGYAGVSFNHPVEKITLDGVRGACEKMAGRGVVAILATLTTDPVEDIIARARRLASLRAEDELLGSMIAGLHIEGPMINAAEGPRGAHPAEHVIAPADAPGFLDNVQEASGGMVRLLTLAPERPGAMELIAKASGDGIVVALGHHEADVATIAQAVEAGATMCTHLGNGSHAMLPRLDNYVQHQLADDRLVAGFIADGHHIPFPTLKNFLRAKGTQRSALVTDAVLVADMPPGSYGSGVRTRMVSTDGSVRLKGTPYLAGSALTLDKAVLNVAAHCDVSFEAAWAMASTQPAEMVGLARAKRVEVEVSDEGFSRRA